MSALVAQSSHPDGIHRYARYAGVAMLLSIVFGALGEAYLPGKIIVPGDAAATAANIIAHPTLFRMTFAAYLVEGFCDIVLCVLWYIILKPVHRNLALISAFTFAIAQSHFWASSIILKDAGGMTAFTEEQRAALAYLSLRTATMIATLFFCFYGTASAIRGFLIVRSGYLPKILGVLLLIGGGGFILRSLTYILAPAYGSSLMLIPMAVAGIPLTFWLLVKGVDRAALEGRLRMLAR